MDPQANLDEFWACYDSVQDSDNFETGGWTEAYELAEALAGWLTNGGFAPNWGERGWDAWCVAHGHTDEYVNAYLSTN